MTSPLILDIIITAVEEHNEPDTPAEGIFRTCASELRVTLLLGAMIPLLDAAGVAWTAAFWMFALGYGPLLSRTRRTLRQ